jgi:hypothetical protein
MPSQYSRAASALYTPTPPPPLTRQIFPLCAVFMSMGLWANATDLALRAADLAVADAAELRRTVRAIFAHTRDPRLLPIVYARVTTEPVVYLSGYTNLADGLGSHNAHIAKHLKNVTVSAEGGRRS